MERSEGCFDHIRLGQFQISSRRPSFFQVYDYDDGTKDDLIGEFTTTLNMLSRGAGPDSPNATFECINPTKRAKKSKKYKNSGLVSQLAFRLETRPTFVEYLGTGTVRLNCTFAVDFTLSNGDPNDPESLHFRHPSGWNNYVIAIRSVGEIVEDYDAGERHYPLGEIVEDYDAGERHYPLIRDGEPSFLAKGSGSHNFFREPGSWAQAQVLP